MPRKKKATGKSERPAEKVAADRTQIVPAGKVDLGRVNMQALLSQPYRRELEGVYLNHINAGAVMETALRVQIGQLLLAMKPHYEHGEWTKFCEEYTAYGYLGCRERMYFARRLGGDRFERICKLPPSKVRALLGSLDDDELAELEAGDALGGLGDATLDDVDQMTRAELRAALRKSESRIERGKADRNKLLDEVETLRARLADRSDPADMHPLEVRFTSLYRHLADLASHAETLSDDEILNDVAGGDRAAWGRMVYGLADAFEATMERLAGRAGLPAWIRAAKGQRQVDDDALDA